MLQPDMGTVLLIFGILAASMWSAQIPVKILVYLGVVVSILAVFLTLAASYRLNRVTAFLDPDSATATQIRGVQNAIRNGGFFGKGYGNSELKQQDGAIIEQSTDAIIGVIGEEIGFFGTTLFLSLYVVLLWRGMRAAKYAPDLGGQALATGITVWLVAQAFINVSGMVGLIPLDGVPLPFVSQGGTAIIINLLAVGILLNISAQAQKPKNKAERKFVIN
jgi:cell division protein FtsW